MHLKNVVIDISIMDSLKVERTYDANVESELNANTNCQNDNDGWDGAEVDVEDGHDPEELDDN